MACEEDQGAKLQKGQPGGQRVLPNQAPAQAIHQLPLQPQGEIRRRIVGGQEAAARTA